MPVNDPDNRELVISCGCALFNLRVQAAREGFGAEVVVSPDPNDEDALADVIFTNPLGNKNLSELAEAISNRRTYRKRFADRQISSDIIEDLKSAAECEGERIPPVPAPRRW